MSGIVGVAGPNWRLGEREISIKTQWLHDMFLIIISFGIICIDLLYCKCMYIFKDAFLGL